jgi:hypothetical protein
MTSLPSNLPSTITNISASSPYANPLTPGAYLINSSHGAFPIFCSMSWFGNQYGMNDIDDFYLIMPGYKLIVYTDGSYSNNSTTFDNTSYQNIRYLLTNYANKGSSCRLYYYGTEIKINGIS